MAEKPTEKLDPQKEYISEQLHKTSDGIGEGYGEPLLEELMNRLEKTVADFHEEVSDMLVDLKKRSMERQEKLKNRWANKANESDTPEKDSTESLDEPQEDASDWEKRIEEKESKSSGINKKGETDEKKEKKPKKKGLFKRKKKK